MIDTVLEGPSNLDTSVISTQDPTPPFEEPQNLRPRLIGRMRGSKGFPTLIVLGSVHGNEPSGFLALERVVATLEQDSTGLLGEFVALVGNRRALSAGKRFLKNDLNRHWQPERVERIKSADGVLEAEDLELWELETELRSVIDAAEGPVFAIDLHTTSGPGPCFVVLDDSLKNREFALPVPSTIVVGLEEELSGTVTHYMNNQGLTVFGFEAGQHEDPTSVDRAEAAIWIALESAGVVERGSRTEVDTGRLLLAEDRGSLPHVVEMRYRHGVTPEDEFRMHPGFRNFQSVVEGQTLADDSQGPVTAPETGRILMPLYQKQGEDGFFIVRPLKEVWLEISAQVRRHHWERFIHWLPGVKKHPNLENTFIVDRRWARFLAAELFHLLGYRRCGPKHDRFLFMTRRSEE